MSKSVDIPGNAIATNVAVQRIYIQAGQSIAWLDLSVEANSESSVQLLGVSVRIAEHPGGEHLFVLKGRYQGERVVSFHQDSSLLSGITGVGNRIRNGSLKWRPDEYEG